RGAQSRISSGGLVTSRKISGPDRLASNLTQGDPVFVRAPDFSEKRISLFGPTPSQRLLSAGSRRCQGSAGMD
ncbi:MAG: hypothetical protein QHC89_24810, partial [Bosea sp. (in: a-proteobacteria)]|nr:hypothetical protein [Bosea sp. (in: a-proteobacteria)]